MGALATGFGASSATVERGAEVRPASHPTAGRLQGHQRVLHAEARPRYDIVLLNVGTRMLFGDAKKMVEEVLAALREGAAG